MYSRLRDTIGITLISLMGLLGIIDSLIDRLPSLILLSDFSVLVFNRVFFFFTADKWKKYKKTCFLIITSAYQGILTGRV